MTVGIPDFSSTGITAMDCPEPEMPSSANALSTSITLLDALDGAGGDVAVVFQHIFDLAAVDAAGGIGFRDRDLVADGCGHAEQRRRSGQGFDVADHDLGVGDAGVCGQGMAGREIRAREQQRRGRQIFDHCFLLLFDCFSG